MGMSASQDLLQAKYHRLCTLKTILEQQNEELQTAVDALRKENSAISKQARELCETILKKQQEQGNLHDGDEVWMELPTSDLIIKANEYAVNYFGFWEGRINEALEMFKKRGEAVQKLKEENERLRKETPEKRKASDDGEEILKNENHTNKENLPRKKGKFGAFARKADDLGEVVIYEENGDISDEERKMTSDIRIGPGKTKITAARAPGRIQMEAQRQKELKDARSKEETERAKVEAFRISQVQMAALKILCEEGRSLYPEVEKRLSEVIGKSASNCRQVIRSLKLTGMVDMLKEKGIPKMQLVSFVKVTEFGKNVYRMLEKKDPVESEMDKIIREHSSLRHGYGIKQTAEMLEASDYYRNLNAKVTYLTGRKRINVGQGKNGKQLSLVPDIIVEVPGEEPMYIEYETNDTTPEDFQRKCSKYLNVSGKMYVVVPSIPDLDEVLKRVDAWIAGIKEEGYSGNGFSIQAQTFSGLEESLSAKDRDGNKRTPAPEWKRRGINRSRKGGT